MEINSTFLADYFVGNFINSTDLANLTNSTNATNSTDETFFCHVPQEMATWSDFWTCMAYFTEKDLGNAIFGWIVVILTFVCNWFVIGYCVTHKITVFDQCIIGHCLV
jgi:hypothetical protein